MTRDVGRARGVLRAQTGPCAFQHLRIAPCEALSDVVDHFWFVRWDLDGHLPQTRETLPHPNVHLVIERGLTRIFGVHSTRFTRVLKDRGCALGVKFRAGGFRPFLGRAVSTITDASLPLDDVFGHDADLLEEEVLAADDVHGMMAIAARFLAGRRPAADPRVSVVADMVAGIAADRSLLRVEALADRHGLSKRALQRMFNDYVGVSPKWVINRYRLHEAVERLAGGTDVDWTDLALSLGYFDQAHFIRDFRTLVGRTPGEYVRGAAASA
ncbi:MAG: AraC family transcriptional regulator [Dokdonella sp.]|uniref:AraC family transcriptional regulator n=1 Tax=Dokdonella sp. TaxID=2291710 RepID=UPI00326384D4